MLDLQDLDLQDHDAPTPIARWLHAVTGALGLIVGFLFVDSWSGEVLVVGAIAYVAWAARRPFGLVLAFAAGLLELFERAYAREALVLVIPWVLLYVAVALVSSAIEGATRPE